MRKGLWLILVLSMVLSMGAGCAPAQEKPEAPAQKPAEQQENDPPVSGLMEPAEQQENDPPVSGLMEPAQQVVFEEPKQPQEEILPQGTIFANVYDGYRLTVMGEGFSIDHTFPEVGTFFKSEDTVIEIYKQELDGISAPIYKNYSNGFLNNKKDHILDFEKQMVIGGQSFTVTAWHREKLEKIANDKNYYMVYETGMNNVVWSIFVKTADPAQNPLKYAPWLESMEYFRPTAEAPRWQTKANVKTAKWNKENADFYRRYFDRDASLTWGIFEPIAANGNHTTLNDYEKTVGYEFPVLLTYLGFDDDSCRVSKKVLDAAWAEGKVLEFTLQTSPKEDGSNMMYDILQGEMDDIIETYAQTFKRFGHPILFRLMNEMNGEWCPYSSYNTSKDTIIYREVYRYIYQKFQQAGVNNTIWIWNPNEGSFPNFNWNHMLMYYPGDEYVDIIGLTAYNTGTYYDEVGEIWQDFETLYDEIYADYCARFSQPLMITEFSCAEVGGDKRQWILDMFQKIKEYDRIKVAIWWDETDFDPQTGGISRDYRIDFVLDLFKKELHKKG